MPPAADGDAIHDEPVLIFCPGLGSGADNTADRVAEVIAAILDRRRQGSCHAAELAHLTAPRGLVVGKTVHDEQGAPILHVFELDYRRRLEPNRDKATVAAPPGALRSAVYAIGGFLGLLGAVKRPAKSRRAKLQLAYGFIGVLALILCAAAAVVAWLASVGAADWMPSGVKSFLGVSASTAALTTTAVSVGGWALLRRKLLGVAATLQRIMHYLDADRHRATVTMTIDDAVDGLRDNGWTGPIHLLGYSFGSLMAVDALFPTASGAAENPRLTEAIDSLTTIGCPADAVRLYRKNYFVDRRSRAKAHLPWVNVLNPMDIFGSSFADGGDTADAGKPYPVAGVLPTNVSYGADTLGLGDILKVKGFRTHEGYWGTAEEASCFDGIVGQWIPVRPRPRPQPVR